MVFSEMVRATQMVKDGRCDPREQMQSPMRNSIYKNKKLLDENPRKWVRKSHADFHVSAADYLRKLLQLSRE